MNVALNLVFVAVTGFETIRYAFSENPKIGLLATMAGITLFGLGGLYCGIRTARRQRLGR